MEKLIEAIVEKLQEFFIEAIENNLNTMFNDVNTKVGTIATEVAIVASTTDEALSHTACLCLSSDFFFYLLNLSVVYGRYKGIDLACHL